MTQTSEQNAPHGTGRIGRSRELDERGAPAGTPQAPRSTTVIYLVALLIIAGISLTSHFLTNRIVARQENTALLVNTAGRQRMLSQRIARLADEVADGSISGSAGRPEILALASRMEAAQHQMVYGDVTQGMLPATSPRLRVIYFGNPIHLEQQVNTFLAHARAFAQRSAPTMRDPDLLALRYDVTAPLLNGLDAAVSEYQSASEHDVRHLRHVMNSLTGMMLVVLVLEALLIYRPLFNRLTGAISLLIKVSNTDFLTGAMNRRAFLGCAEDELATARRLQQPLCLLMADVDHFKQINDTYGHPAGDLVIQHFASVVETSLRKNDLLGRIGGEEFAVLLPGTSLQEGMLVAERVRERFAATTTAATSHAQPIAATVSIGVVCVAAGTLDDLLAQADQLLYRAKQSGRNRVEAADSIPTAVLGWAGVETGLA